MSPSRRQRLRKTVAGCVAVGSILPCFAHAQSSVTLYGVVDAFYGYFSNSQTSMSSLNSGGAGGSRWGMRAKEDLGGGLSAIAVLESGYNVNNGKSGQSGRLFGRQSYVGLDSRWGGLIAGRLQTPGYDWALTFDPIMMTAGSVLGSLTGEEPRPWMFNPLIDPSRQDNTVQYNSPVWHGLSGAAAYSFGTTPGTATNTTYEFATLRYANGPLLTSYGFGHSLTKSPGANSNTLEHALGVKYDLNWLALYGTYQLRLNDPGATDKAWQVGFTVPTGVAGTFRFSYGGLSDQKEATPGNWSVRSWAVGYTYSLSKSTMVYTFFKKLYNGGIARQSIYYPQGGLPPSANYDENNSAFGLGMVTRF
ncbi:porin [Paraburkholderia phymatum]|uniref:porin n=1 Tax=Paraburkholderia phymatum TaxID=148447 RepID=UPI003171E1A8